MWVGTGSVYAAVIELGLEIWQSVLRAVISGLCFGDKHKEFTSVAGKPQEQQETGHFGSCQKVTTIKLWERTSREFGWYECRLR